jgi:hypothetical protein
MEEIYMEIWQGNELIEAINNLTKAVKELNQNMSEKMETNNETINELNTYVKGLIEK